MDAFIGTWKIIKKVNLDEYLKAIGIDEVSNDVKLTETVSKEGEYVVWKIMNSHHARDMKFILDKVFHDGTLQGRQCFSTINLNGNQLVQVWKWDKTESTIIREVKGNNMIMTLKCGDVEAQRIYEKV